MIHAGHGARQASVMTGQEQKQGFMHGNVLHRGYSWLPCAMAGHVACAGFFAQPRHPLRAGRYGQSRAGFGRCAAQHDGAGRQRALPAGQSRHPFAGRVARRAQTAPARHAGWCARSPRCATNDRMAALPAAGHVCAQMPDGACGRAAAVGRGANHGLRARHQPVAARAGLERIPGAPVRQRAGPVERQAARHGSLALQP